MSAETNFYRWFKEIHLKPPQGFTYVPAQLARDYPLEEMDNLF